MCPSLPLPPMCLLIHLYPKGVSPWLVVLFLACAILSCLVILGVLTALHCLQGVTHCTIVHSQ